MVKLIMALISLLGVSAEETPLYLYPMVDFQDSELGDVTYIDFWSC
jgi:hypothetical protein